MNVYEAIEKSPVHRAWYTSYGVASQGDYLKDLHDYYPDGWQPLYNGDEVEQWKQRAEKAEAQLYAACQQLAGEYVLGEPLDKVQRGENYITFDKVTKEWGQVTVRQSGSCCGARHAYYADPRPWPKPPEKKEEPKLFRSYGADYHLLTDEGRRRLERLLQESEGE